MADVFDDSSTFCAEQAGVSGEDLEVDLAELKELRYIEAFSRMRSAVADDADANDVPAMTTNQVDDLLGGITRVQQIFDDQHSLANDLVHEPGALESEVITTLVSPDCRHS